VRIDVEQKYFAKNNAVDLLKPECIAFQCRLSWTSVFS